MPNLAMSREEFVRRGEEYYNRFLRDELESGHKGEYLVLDVESGEYEMDAEKMTAIDRARVRECLVRFFTSFESAIAPPTALARTVLIEPILHEAGD